MGLGRDREEGGMEGRGRDREKREGWSGEGRGMTRMERWRDGEERGGTRSGLKKSRPMS